jgi:tetratricopeptide (TPR) repeat protein
LFRILCSSAKAINLKKAFQPRMDMDKHGFTKGLAIISSKSMDEPNQRTISWPQAGRWTAGWCALWLTVLTARAEESAFTNLLAQATLAGEHTNWPEALRSMAVAEDLAGTNCAQLCVVTKGYCDLMHLSCTEATQQRLAEQALATAQRAERADGSNAIAHLCVAVCYVKNFPYAPNARKVVWSRAIKTECETAIALDPKQDVGYYLLGRWEFGVANMNFLVKGLVRLVYGGLPEASNGEAIRDFQTAIALAPWRIIHHAELAKVYAATGELKRARQEWERCVALTPVDADDADAQAEARQRLIALGE